MCAFNDLSCQWLAVTPNNALEWTAGKRGSVWPRMLRTSNGHDDEFVLHRPESSCREEVFQEDRRDSTAHASDRSASADSRFRPRDSRVNMDRAGMISPNHALQRTRPSRSDCNPPVLRAGLAGRSIVKFHVQAMFAVALSLSGCSKTLSHRRGLWIQFRGSRSARRKPQLTCTPFEGPVFPARV